MPVVAIAPTATPLSQAADQGHRAPNSRGGAPATPGAEASPTPPPLASTATIPSAAPTALRPAEATMAPAGTEPTPSVAITGTPAPTAKPGPDEPFAYVARYEPECEVLLGQVPALPQLRNLSCEAATIRMALAGRGIEASEEEILERMGQSDDPRQGFRGNVDGDGHGESLADYGVYAEVVERVLETFDVPAEAVYGMSDWQLRQAVRGGAAVIVWVTGRENPRIVEEQGYRLVEEEHVYVVVGLLRDGRLLVHDPWGARADSGRAGTFPVWAIQQWVLFDRQAVVVPLD